jgi:hypothetical protein
MVTRSPAMPGRMSPASEAFSGAIDFLFPDARRTGVDGSPGELDALITGYGIGDPTADALVAAMRAKRVTSRQFESALTGGIGAIDDPAPELQAFFATVDQVPAWIVEERVALGVRTQRRIDGITSAGAGWALGFLLAAILPNSARAMSTNARAVENAGRRFAETGRIALDLFAIDGRGRFGAGTLSSTRLRILHANVRAALLRGGDWDIDFYGVPISASDNLGASFASIGTVQTAMRLGYRFTPAELDGVAQFAALFAYRQGVPADLIPRTYADQLRWFQVTLRTSRGIADPEAIGRLMPALVAIEVENLPRAAQGAVRHLFNAYGRLIYGPELCDATGIPDTPLRRMLPLATGALIRPFEAARARSPHLDRATQRGADLMWRRLMPVLYSDRANYDADHVATVVKA